MLDEHGFKRKSYDELLYDMSERAKVLYGSDINTSSHSVLGIFLRVMAWFLSLIYELAERVYHSGFISQATGVSLDRLGANTGISRLPATVAMVELSFKGKAGYTIKEGVRFQTVDQLMFQMIDVVKLDSSGSGIGTAISMEYQSRYNVPANSITEQVEPTEDLYSVTNPSAAAGGTERETDSDYRKRIRLSVRGNPGPPINGIITALLGVSGVRTCSVIENNTNTNDSYGNPPKSIHAYVLGGNKEDVANTLFSNIAAGIQTVGSQAVSVKDIGGFAHTVRFDFATSVSIYVKVVLTTDAKFEGDGETKVKESISDYINNLSMGESVKFSYLYPELYRIPGIVVADVGISTTASNFAAKNIEISAHQTAECQTLNVAVTVNGV